MIGEGGAHSVSHSQLPRSGSDYRVVSKLVVNDFSIQSTSNKKKAQDKRVRIVYYKGFTLNIDKPSSNM